jgi:hypothetical protein
MLNNASIMTKIDNMEEELNKLSSIIERLLIGKISKANEAKNISSLNTSLIL